jgi:SRSO17 transposase
MSYVFDGRSEERLHAYFDRIGSVLRNKRQRAAFAIYAVGLFGDTDRKSAEPIAAAACGDPGLCRAYHDRLLRFIGRAEWDDEKMRLAAARYAILQMKQDEAIETWIVDDTGFLKQGSESPGVQRQYTGSAGKTTNCQLGVSLTLTTRTIEVPVDMDLYLPKSWTEDRERCRKAHIPDDVAYRQKWRIALDMIHRAKAARLPPGLVLADSGYGNVGDFRAGLRKLGLDYAVDVNAETRVKIVCDDGSVSETMSVACAADVLGEGTYRKVTWRDGTRDTLQSRFAAVRVQVVRRCGTEEVEQWLVVERPDPQRPPTHYVLSTLSKEILLEELVRRIKQRWRIERTYEDMKGELGLDHFEGRSYRGWQHHISVVLTCYAFIASERARAFPPEVRRSEDRDEINIAA